jgi:uncharacterized damage-inducible protein DinB
MQPEKQLRPKDPLERRQLRPPRPQREADRPLEVASFQLSHCRDHRASGARAGVASASSAASLWAGSYIPSDVWYRSDAFRRAICFRRRVPSDVEIGFPAGNADELELLLSWLGYLRRAVIRKIADVNDDDARWTPNGRLISLVGIVNHLTNVEWRWIDGGMRGEEVSRDEGEFHPGRELTVDSAITSYRARAEATDNAVRALGSLTSPNLLEEGAELRWVLLHLINETARHAGHADAVRELLDGTTGE